MTTQPFGGGGVDIITDGVNNYVMTAVDSETIQGEANLTFDSSDLHIGDGGGMVIGHTAQETISIDGSTDLVPEFQILGTGAADASMMLAAFSTTATIAGSPILGFVKSGDAAIDGTHVVVTDGEELGNIVAYGDDGTDLESIAAQIQFEVDGSPGTGDMPGRIVFATTADGSQATTEAMRITSGQNVGINTTTASLYNPLTVLKDATIGLSVISDTSHTEYAAMGATADYAHFYGGSGASATVGMKFYTTISGSEYNSMILSGGISPTLQMGLASDADSMIFFDTNSTDYHIGWGVDEDDLIIGFGATLGTTPVISVSPIGNGRVTIGKQQETATHGLLYLNPDTVTVGANKPYHYLYMSNNNVITIPSGTASLVTAMNIEIPNITATGTVTQTATVRIAGAMSEGTTDYALLVDDGVSRFDGDVHLGIAGGTYTKLTSAGAITGSGTNISLSRTGSGAITVSDDISLVPYGGSAVIIGDGTAEDTELRFDGNAVDYHIGLSDASPDDLLVIGRESTIGAAISMAFASTEGRASLGNNGNADGLLVPASNLGLKLRYGFGDIGSTTHYGASLYGYGTQEGGNASGAIGGIQVGAVVEASSDSSFTSTGWPGLVAINTYTATESGSFGGSAVAVAADIWVGTGSVAGTPITNKYGIYIADQTQGTNDYGLYIAGADTYAIWVAADTSRFDGVSVHYDGVQLGYAGSNAGEDLLCYGDASGSYMWWDASSNLLNIKHNTAGTTVTVMQFIDSDSAIVGSITTNSTGNSTAFNTSSDYRLKENEAPIADGLQRLRELKPYTFNWKKNPDFRQDGFFAHEVTDVVPIATAGEKDGEEYQAIDHSKLIPLLTAAIQALDEKVTALGG